MRMVCCLPDYDHVAWSSFILVPKYSSVVQIHISCYHYYAQHTPGMQLLKLHFIKFPTSSNLHENEEL